MRLGVLQAGMRQHEAHFQELQARLSLPPQAPCMVARLRSVEQVESGAGGACAEVALVTPMPPASTGIATYSLCSFLQAERRVDIFTMPVSDADFLIQAHRLGDGGCARLLHAEYLGYAQELHRYETIVFALGNSTHHFYVWPILTRLIAEGSSGQCVLYLHDLVLHNLLQLGRGLGLEDYLALIRATYPAGSVDLAGLTERDSASAHYELFRQGVYGMRLLHALGFRRFMVNSARAADMLSQDLSGLSFSCSQLFLPVCLPPAAATLPAALAVRQPGHVCIGTFGIPSMAKGTDRLIRAITQLNDSGIPARLVVAGYSVTEFFRLHPDLSSPHLDCVDSPSDSELVELMRSVDVAVQLRPFEAGESSGIVPQLLALGRTVLVSRVGAFIEYGDAVRFCDQADDLPALICEALESPVSAESIAAYVNRHTPAVFQRAFHAALQGPLPVAARCM